MAPRSSVSHIRHNGISAQDAQSSAVLFYNAASTADSVECVRCSYLAALKAAASVVACEPRLWNSRPLTRDVWTLLERSDYVRNDTTGQWQHDIAYFRALARLRQDIEMGFSVAFTSQQVSEIYSYVGDFLERVDEGMFTELAA